MRVPEQSADAPPASGIRLLVADDDDSVRSLLATLLGDADGVSCVLEAESGLAAVDLARLCRIDVAILDLNMPGLDGVETAQALREMQPSMRIALHSTDPDLFRGPAVGLGLPLFDKVEFERLVDWIERQAGPRGTRGGDGSSRGAQLAPRLELACSRCGYGIVTNWPPDRCPMCRAGAAWAKPPPGRSQAALHSS